MSTPIGTLTIEMAANVVRLRKDMEAANKTVGDAMGKIQRSADSAMRALSALGVGLSVGAFAGWIKGAIDAIDRLNDISAATGITVGKLAGLDYAAKLSGTNLDAVTQASNKLQLGLTTNSAALTKVGVTAQDPIEALAQLADVYAATEGQSNKAAVASLALGKSWQSIASVLAQGGDNLRRLIEEGESLSGVTQETANDAAKFNDEIDKLSTRLGALALNIAGPILKVFSDFIDELNEGTKAAGGFWKAIGLLGTTNPFLSLEESVSKYKKEVEELTEKQQKNSELANLAFGVNDKLANATQRLAYFEAMLAIETRKKASALAEGASGANSHVTAYNAMITAADDLIEQMEIEFSLIGLTNEERAVSIAMRKLEEIGIRNGTEAYEKYLGQILDIQKRIGIKKEMVRLSDESAKNAKRESEEYDRLVKSFGDQIAKMQIENDTYFDGNAARERAIFLRDTENLKIDDRNRLLAQYDEAAAIKEANELRKKVIDDQLKEQEKYAKEMEKINDQIGQSLTDALMNGGKNAKEYLTDLFRTLILRPLLQPVIAGAAGALGFGAAGQAIASSFSGGGGVAEGAGGMGQSMGMLSIASGLKSAYDAVSGGFAAIGSSAASLAGNLMGAKDAAAAFMAGSGEASMAALSNLQSINAMSASIGAAAQFTAGIGAGIGLGQMISGEYKVGGSSFLTTGGGAVIGAILGGPIGGVIGGAIGGVINRAFGMGKEKVVRSGLELRPTIDGTEASGFVNTLQKGGWFRSDKKRSKVVELDQTVTDAFDQTARSIGASVAVMTNSLGVSIADINSFQSQMTIVDTLGKTEEEIQAQIDDVFATFSNSLTEFLIPSIRDFARSAEETSSTILNRLFTSITTVNQSFKVLGYTLYEMTLQGAAASQELVDLFGTIENFTKSTAYFYDNFYNTQEKVEFQIEQLTSTMATLGLTVPQTNEAFRQLVDSAKASGDDALFATLVQLAPAFNNLTTSISAFVDTAFQDLQAAIQREQKTAIDALEAQKTIAKAQADVASENVDSLTSIFDYLTGQINDLTGAVASAQSAAQGSAFIQDAINTANSTGYLPDQAALESAVFAVRSGMGATSYSTSYEQRLAQMQLAAQLSSLNSIAGDQKTTAELQLEIAQEQLDSIEAQITSSQDYYDTQLTYAQSQIDELKGINGGILSVADAMVSFGAAVNASRMTIDSGMSGQINALYQEIFGRSAESAGLANWLASGKSIEEIRQGILNSDEAKLRGYASGGFYPGGLAMVGEDGAELINFNRPGQVYTAGQTAEILGGGGLATEIQGLRDDLQAQARANVQIQARTAKVLERWESSGLPDTRIEV